MVGMGLVVRYQLFSTILNTQTLRAGAIATAGREVSLTVDFLRSRDQSSTPAETSSKVSQIQTPTFKTGAAEDNGSAHDRRWRRKAELHESCWKVRSLTAMGLRILP